MLLFDRLLKNLHLGKLVDLTNYGKHCLVFSRVDNKHKMLPQSSCDVQLQNEQNVFFEYLHNNVKYVRNGFGAEELELGRNDCLFLVLHSHKE